MKLRTVYVRFYRAFNFDYLRQSEPPPPNERKPWDQMNDGSYCPYVRLKIDDQITSIVGANESGKSQLLQAIESALSGESPSPGDFCRYSPYFTVADRMGIPHVGFQFDQWEKSEFAKLRQILESNSDIADPDALLVESETGDPDPEEADSEIEPGNSNDDNFHSKTEVRIFREDSRGAIVYLNDEPHTVADFGKFKDLLPGIFRIDADRAIPDSVPISFLATKFDGKKTQLGPSRAERMAFFGALEQNAGALINARTAEEELAEAIKSTLQNINWSGLSGVNGDKKRSDQLQLAYDLLVTVGGINGSAFKELQRAVSVGNEGLASAIVSSMNRQLESSLNLARWWSQDDQFRITLAIRDFDLVFTIRDRTGSEYVFAERSDGLRYFLSYLVQLQTHMREMSRSEILLMDEPDTYLSNSGQHDLMRILQEFSDHVDSPLSRQVLYVTHSPFLIDKNRADRIRVLDKGF